MTYFMFPLGNTVSFAFNSVNHMVQIFPESILSIFLLTLISQSPKIFIQCLAQKSRRDCGESVIYVPSFHGTWACWCFVCGVLRKVKIIRWTINNAFIYRTNTFKFCGVQVHLPGVKHFSIYFTCIVFFSGINHWCNVYTV